MTMDFLTIAQTASADPQISGAWVLKLVAGIFSGAAVLWAAFKKGEAKGSASRTIVESPLPEVTTRAALVYAESKTVDEHKSTNDAKFAEIADDIDDLHTRINAAFKVLNILEGTVTGINENVGRLLDMALNRPAGTTIQNQRTRKTPN